MAWNKSTPPDIRQMVDEISKVLGYRPNYSERSKEGRSYKWYLANRTLIGQIKQICEKYTDIYAKLAYTPEDGSRSSGLYSGIRILCKGVQ